MYLINYFEWAKEHPKSSFFDVMMKFLKVPLYVSEENRNRATVDQAYSAINLGIIARVNPQLQFSPELCSERFTKLALTAINKEQLEQIYGANIKLGYWWFEVQDLTKDEE